MDPATALAVVNTIAWPVVKLGGLGAAYIGPMMGFTATGVLKGSLAAAAQSAIPNVAAGSLFSGMQSAAATSVAVVGVVPAAVTGVVAYGAYRAGAVGYVGRKVGGFVKDKIM